MATGDRRLGPNAESRIKLADGTWAPYHVALGADGNPTTNKRGALTDRSGTVTSGGTAQNAAAANTSRNYLMIENPQYKVDGVTLNPVERLCFRTDAAAVQGAGSICLDIGQGFEFTGFIPTGAVSVIAATTGHAWTCKEG